MMPPWPLRRPWPEKKGVTYTDQPREGKVDFLALRDGLLFVESDRLERFNLVPGSCAPPAKLLLFSDWDAGSPAPGRFPSISLAGISRKRWGSSMRGRCSACMRCDRPMSASW